MRALVPVLTTERTRLRAPSYGDFPLWRDLYAAPEAVHLGGPYPAEAAWEEFTCYAGGWIMHGHGLWSVDRREDGALLGFVFVGLEWDDPAPELGYLFAEHTRGHGYATEAALAARDFGLDLLGAGNLYSFIAKGNAASLALAERIGGVEATREEVWDRIDADTIPIQYGVAA